MNSSPASDRDTLERALLRERVRERRDRRYRTNIDFGLKCAARLTTTGVALLAVQKIDVSSLSLPW